MQNRLHLESGSSGGQTYQQQKSHARYQHESDDEDAVNFHQISNRELEEKIHQMKM